MFGDLGDDVIALVAQGEEAALECKIVGLAAAAGDDNLIRLSAGILWPPMSPAF